MSIPSPAIADSYDIIERRHRRRRTHRRTRRGQAHGPSPRRRSAQPSSGRVSRQIQLRGGESAQAADLVEAGLTFVGGVELDLRVQAAETLQRFHNQELGRIGKVFTCTSRWSAARTRARPARYVHCTDIGAGDGE